MTSHKFYSSSGSIKLSNTETKAVGATADVAKTFTTPGKYRTAEGTKLRPRPIARETAIITIFRLLRVTSLNTFNPAAATIPNITITPPPKTIKALKQ